MSSSIEIDRIISFEEETSKTEEFFWLWFRWKHLWSISNIHCYALEIGEGSSWSLSPTMVGRWVHSTPRICPAIGNSTTLASSFDYLDPQTLGTSDGSRTLCMFLHVNIDSLSWRSHGVCGTKSPPNWTLSEHPITMPSQSEPEIRSRNCSSRDRRGLGQQGRCLVYAHSSNGVKADKAVVRTVCMYRRWWWVKASLGSCWLPIEFGSFPILPPIQSKGTNST